MVFFLTDFLGIDVEMNKNFHDLNNIEFIEIEGGCISVALALSWGITKAVGIVSGTTTTVYVSGTIQHTCIGE